MTLASLKKSVRALIDTFAAEIRLANSPAGQPVVTKQILAVLGQFASAITSSLVAAWVAQDILRYNFTLVVMLAFALFFLLSTIIQTRWLPLGPNLYRVFVLLFTLVILEGLALAFLYAATRPPSVYLVLDATEKAKPSFSDFISSVRFTAAVQPENMKSGLRVYGGNANGTGDCNDTVQLIEPIPSKDYKPRLDSVLPTLTPGGSGSMTIAVFDTIRDDLKQQAGPIKLVVITSGIDSNCDPAKGGILQRIAKDIKENNRTDLTIAIISIGKMTDDEDSVLESYAKAFNGYYMNAPTANQVPALILAPPNYFAEYSTRPKPTATPHP